MTIQPATETTASEVSPFLEAPEDAQFLVLSHSSLEAEDLCSMRMVCRAMRDLIDSPSHNPIWRCLSIRKGLRPMTVQEQTSQTYQEYFRRNWVFVKLKNGTLLHPTIIRILNPDCRLISVIKAASRAGHEMLVCQALENVRNNKMLKPDLRFCGAVLDKAVEEGQEKLFSKVLVEFSVLKTFPLDESLLRAVSQGHIGIVKQLIALEKPDDMPIQSTTLSQALCLTAGWGRTDIALCLLDHFMGRISPEAITSAYLMAVTTDHVEIAKLLSPHAEPSQVLRPVNEVKATFQEDFYDNLTAAIESPDLEHVELCLQLQDCMNNLTSHQLESIVRSAGDAFPEILELFLNHPQLGPLLDSAVVVRKFQRFAYNTETVMRVLRRFYEKVFTSPIRALFAREINGAPLRKISLNADQKDFYCAYSKLLEDVVRSGNLELMRAMLANNQPRIPEALVPAFIKAATVDERTEQTRFEDLRTACLEHPTEIEWFITNYPELFVEGYSNPNPQ